VESKTKALLRSIYVGRCAVLYFNVFLSVINEGCVVEINGTEGKCSVSERSNSNLTEKQLILCL
jgi:hypothetical protein